MGRAHEGQRRPQGQVEGLVAQNGRHIAFEEAAKPRGSVVVCRTGALKKRNEERKKGQRVAGYCSCMGLRLAYVREGAGICFSSAMRDACHGRVEVSAFVQSDGFLDVVVNTHARA